MWLLGTLGKVRGVMQAGIVVNAEVFGTEPMNNFCDVFLLFLLAEQLDEGIEWELLVNLLGAFGRRMAMVV